MTLNKNWQEEWDNIEIPHEKINLMIDNAVKEIPNKKKNKFNSPLFIFTYGVIATTVLAGIVFMVSSQSTSYKTASEVRAPAAKMEAKSEVADMSGVETDKGKFYDSEISSEDQPSMKVDTSVDSKIVTEYQMSKQTESLKDDYDKLEKLVEEYQGSIANSDIDLAATNYSYPSAYVSLNIPTEKIKDFLENLEKIGKTITSSVNQHDVSTEYFDNESRIKALETEEKALLDILEKSEKVSDMISIQERLATVRSERESLVKNNKIFDKQVNYTTIHLSIEEVVTAKPQKTDSFWERVKLSWKNQQVNLKNFGENLLVFLLSYGIYIIVVIGLGYVAVRKKIGK